VVKIPPFDATEQFRQIGDQINQAVSAVLASGQYVGGPNVKEFEQEFAAYVGCSDAVACNSGTDALYLALRALGVGAGDEVIVPPFTFFASAETVSLVGAKPVFVDIEADSFNLDVSKIEAAITDRTRAIMPVHLFGRPVNMTAIMAIARKHNLYVVEDCAQAVGATWEGQQVGSIGDVGCFSFYPTKNLGCCGDGGMLTTNNPELAQTSRVIKEHGSPQRYYHTTIGINSRMDAVQAAILRVKLPYLDKWNHLRHEAIDRYDQYLQHVDGIITPSHCPGSVWNQYSIRFISADRDKIQAQIREQGVITITYYPVPLHLQEAYADLGHKPGDFPVSELVSKQVLSLPLFPEITDEQQQYVVNALKSALQGAT
jgi:dTDP-4-amino-4,6-dideoxygalactose transaminase